MWVTKNIPHTHITNPLTHSTRAGSPSLGENSDSVAMWRDTDDQHGSVQEMGAGSNSEQNFPSADRKL